MPPETAGELAVRRAVVAAARRMAALRLTVGTGGNLSARTEHGLVITPSRFPYRDLRPSMLVATGLDLAADERLQHPGGLQPSRELPLHRSIYGARRDARAVVHTHSPYATAWSFLGLPLEPVTEDNEYYAIGPVKTSAPAPSGSAQLGMRAAEALAGSRAVLLARHGVLTLGDDPESALVAAEVVEHQAHVAWLLRAGGARQPGEICEHQVRLQGVS